MICDYNYYDVPLLSQQVHDEKSVREWQLAARRAVVRRVSACGRDPSGRHKTPSTRRTLGYGRRA